jgi:hypothetical protein
MYSFYMVHAFLMEAVLLVVIEYTNNIRDVDVTDQLQASSSIQT